MLNVSFLACTKVELTVCIAVHGEKVTLTLIRNAQYQTSLRYFNIFKLHVSRLFLFELSCKCTHRHKHKHTQKDTHTQRLRRVLYSAFCKNATIKI